MQTQAVYGLSGVGFTDPADNSYVGFSMTAGSLKITGGHEVVEQKNSAGVTVAAFNQVAAASVEIEGITDATPGMIARLKGGRLRTGSDALPAAARPSPVRPVDWDGITITAAANENPAPGAYVLTKTAAAATVHRLFTGEGDSRQIANAKGEDATADFDLANIPAGLATGEIGMFFWEPIADGVVGEYIFGSRNLPGLVSVFAMTERNAHCRCRQSQPATNFHTAPPAQSD